MSPPALVLAAGFGSRLTGYADLPKPLVFFRDRRLIEWNLLWLAENGVSHVWINLHHRAAEFRSILGDGTRYGIGIRYSEEPQILGTAGGWRRLRGSWTQPSLVICGDNVMRFDLRRLLQLHETGAPRTLCTIALFDPAVHANTGIAGGRVELAASGDIRGFVEGSSHAPGGYVNAGAYVVDPGLADRIGEGVQDFGRDVFPGLVRDGALRGHVIETDGYCLGLDTPECFAIAEQLAASGKVRL